MLWVATAGLTAQREVDPLTRARQAYNEQQFDRAVSFANDAKRNPAQLDSASLVIARALLERFRRTTDPADLDAARKALLAVNTAKLTLSEASEMHLGMAEMMYVDQQFGAATELFEVALDRPAMVPARNRDRVLEWWAASLDSYAQYAPDIQRGAKYWRMLTRLEQEAVRGPATPAVAYWMAAAARGIGDPERAWSLAIAGWIQAPLIAGGRAAALRADLDKLMEAIILERAHDSADADAEALKIALAAEWAAIKERWKSGPTSLAAPPWWRPCRRAGRRTPGS
jgi:hypothetical protein